MKKTAHVYRFNDRVAVYLGSSGSTVYLQPREAKAIAAAMNACARDIAKCEFTSSQMCTRDFELSEK